MEAPSVIRENEQKNAYGQILCDVGHFPRGSNLMISRMLGK